MGFNGVRKHQKIEDPRYLYWADMLGLLVWEEMPSAYRFTRTLHRAADARVDGGDRARLRAIPASWPGCRSTNRGACPTCPTVPAQRHYVQALYHLTKTLDPTRPVIGNDGWESVATDIIGIHDYDDEPDRIARRYWSDESRRGCSSASGRAAACCCSTGTITPDQPIMLTEFGGIAYSQATRGTWGYSRCRHARGLRRAATGAAGRGTRRCRCSPASATPSSPTRTRKRTACSTPTARPRSRSSRSALATRGGRSARDRQVEAAWRERIMNFQRQQYLVPMEDHQVQERR